MGIFYFSPFFCLQISGFLFFFLFLSAADLKSWICIQAQRKSFPEELKEWPGRCVGPKWSKRPCWSWVHEAIAIAIVSEFCRKLPFARTAWRVPLTGLQLLRSERVLLTIWIEGLEHLEKWRKVVALLGAPPKELHDHSQGISAFLRHAQFAAFLFEIWWPKVASEFSGACQNSQVHWQTYSCDGALSFGQNHLLLNWNLNFLVCDNFEGNGHNGAGGYSCRMKAVNSVVAKSQGEMFKNAFFQRV